MKGHLKLQEQFLYKGNITGRTLYLVAHPVLILRTFFRLEINKLAVPIGLFLSDVNREGGLPLKLRLGSVIHVTCLTFQGQLIKKLDL